MSDPTITITLTHREAVALARTGELLAGAFEDAGCDLTDVERSDGTLGASPLLSAVLKLELAVTLAGVEL